MRKGVKGDIKLNGDRVVSYGEWVIDVDVICKLLMFLGSVDDEEWWGLRIGIVDVVNGRSLYSFWSYGKMMRVGLVFFVLDKILYFIYIIFCFFRVIFGIWNGDLYILDLIEVVSY